MEALIVVDYQYDFRPGGALAVEGGDDIREGLLAAIDDAELVVFSKDWHPAGHCSFLDQGGPWPPHCVQNTRGASFDPALIFAAAGRFVVVTKGADLDRDAYSAFQGRHRGMPLMGILRENGVTSLLVGGLATDYCVKATVLDALNWGLGVALLADCVAAVDVHPGDGQRAIEEMTNAGAAMRATTRGRG